MTHENHFHLLEDMHSIAIPKVALLEGQIDDAFATQFTFSVENGQANETITIDYVN